MGSDVTGAPEACVPSLRLTRMPDDTYCRLSGLFDDPRVHVLTCAINAAAVGLLSEKETAAMAGFVEKRRREYATARALARAGLERFFGVRDFDLLNADDRSPIWPEGICGSIAHSDTRAWVALVEAGYGTIGIDGEARTELGRDLWRLTLRDEERADVEALPASSRGRRALALFSAKEALYKAQYPRSGLFMQYMALRVESDDVGALRCTFQQDVGPFPRGFVARGRSLDGNELVSAVWIPAT
jgi:4'-phosphopantetheinyl transferase EntD